MATGVGELSVWATHSDIGEGTFCYRVRENGERAFNTCGFQQWHQTSKWKIGTLEKREITVSYTPGGQESNEKVISYSLTILPPDGEYPNDGTLRRIQVEFEYTGQEHKFGGNKFLPVMRANVFQQDTRQIGMEGDRKTQSERLENGKMGFFCAHSKRSTHINLGTFRLKRVGLFDPDQELRSHAAPAADLEPAHVAPPKGQVSNLYEFT